MTDEPASIEYKGYRIRVLNWNGQYKAWISKMSSPIVRSGFGGGTEVSSGEWCDTHDAAIAAAKADIDAGKWH